MNNQTPTDAPTFESVWAGFQETYRLIQEGRKELKETERIFKEQVAENERQRREQAAENERQRKEQAAENDRQRKEQAAENERQRKEQAAENDRQRKETERILKKQAELTAESERKREKNWADYEKRMKKIDEQMGAWSNNHGSFAEEYFFNSFDAGEQNFFGEQFDDIEQNLKPKSIKFNNMKIQDEYDIVLYNHSSVAIIEVKFKAHENDIAQTLKKAETFRILCPDYKDFKIYLGLASMSFYKELEKKCTEQGIAIIKQIGDSVVINDAHLKVF